MKKINESQLKEEIINLLNDYKNGEIINEQYWKLFTKQANNVIGNLGAKFSQGFYRQLNKSLGKKLELASQKEISEALRTAEMSVYRQTIARQIFKNNTELVTDVFSKYNMKVAQEAANAYAELGQKLKMNNNVLMKDVFDEFRGGVKTGANTGANTGGATPGGTKSQPIPNSQKIRDHISVFEGEFQDLFKTNIFNNRVHRKRIESIYKQMEIKYQGKPIPDNFQDEVKKLLTDAQNTILNNPKIPANEKSTISNFFTKGLKEIGYLASPVKFKKYADPTGKIHRDATLGGVAWWRTMKNLLFYSAVADVTLDTNIYGTGYNAAKNYFTRNQNKTQQPTTPSNNPQPTNTQKEKADW